MKRILVLTTSLSQGGITSFLIPLTNLLCELGHKVTLAYTVDTGDFLERINPAVKKLKYVPLSHRKTIYAWICSLAFYDMARVAFRAKERKPHYPSVQRLNYIAAKKTALFTEEFDIAISTAEGYCNALVANKINSKKKIGWVHPNMASIGLDTRAAQPILDKFAAVASVSEEGTDALKNFFQKDKEKFIYIENLVDCERICSMGQQEIEDMPQLDGYMNIVTVCRITNESKRLDRVVKIAAVLKSKKFKFRWYLVGDGPDSTYIKSLIEKNNLQEDLIMLGGRNNPLPYIRQADCFVLTSQFEGKPVVVEEAKILHTPVIATEYSSAKAQLPPNLGIVVPNVDGVLEDAIAKLLTDNKVISRLKYTCRSFKCDNSKSIEKIMALLQ